MKIQYFLWLLVIFCQFFVIEIQANELRMVKTETQYDIKQVQLISRILDQAHRIYAESWRVLLASKSAPASPMKVIADELKKKRARTKKMQWEIAELTEFNPLNRKMNFEFQPENFRQVFGESLVILNRRANCEISYDEKEKIKSMLCQGLGQNLSKTQHIEFHKIQYATGSGQLLEVTADKYENLLKKVQCSSNDPCLHMKVPLDGKIKIIENHILEKEKEQTPPPSNAKIENVNTQQQPNQQNTQQDTQQPKEQDEKSEPRQRRTEIPVEGDREPGL